MQTRRGTGEPKEACPRFWASLEDAASRQTPRDCQIELQCHLVHCRPWAAYSGSPPTLCLEIAASFSLLHTTPRGIQVMRLAVLVFLLGTAACTAAQSAASASALGAASPLTSLLQQGVAAYSQGLSSMLSAASAFKAQSMAQLQSFQQSTEKVLAAAEAGMQEA